jgi:hypothetical protein
MELLLQREAPVTLRIFDRAEEFRIEISGRFAGGAVTDAEKAWKTALNANNPRRISVDIAGMSSYDEAGCKLLREMQLHGTHIVAGTARSLVFLSQITGPQRAPGPSLVGGKKGKAGKLAAVRPFAAGE